MGAFANDDARPEEDIDVSMLENEPMEPGSNGISGKTPMSTRVGKEEEASVLPDGNQIMIRTIPPDIGREALESVGHFFKAWCWVYSCIWRHFL